MDMDVLKTDAIRAFGRLPRPMLIVVAREIVANLKGIEEQIPNLIEDLKPHVAAAMVEFSCGIMDVPALEKTLIEALAHYGVDVPPMLSAPSST